VQKYSDVVETDLATSTETVIKKNAFYSLPAPVTVNDLIRENTSTKTALTHIHQTILSNKGVQSNTQN
jgi:hypothetical protein